MRKNTKFNNFFNLGNLYFSDLFNQVNYIWEPISNLRTYISKQFEEGKVRDNYKGKNNVYIGEGTVVDEGVEIIGPAIIGKNCLIGHGSFLRENCLIGNNVHIGHAVEIKNSILLNNAISAHLNYIGDSIIGNNVNMSGGVIIANLRLDKKHVSVLLEGKKIDTKLDKLGSIIGDNSIIGVNAVLNPGVILEKNCKVFPLVSVVGCYKKNSLVK